MTNTSYLAKFGPTAEVVAADPDLFINPNEPGKCGKIVCQDPAVIVLSDNSRSMRYCDAHAENVRRGNDHWFPIYSAPLAVIDQ